MIIWVQPSLETMGKKSFQITTGIKQGYVIAPTLFSLFIIATLHLVEEYLLSGVETCIDLMVTWYLNRLRANAKVFTTSAIELEYADDNVMMVRIEEDLQAIINAFNRYIEESA